MKKNLILFLTVICFFFEKNISAQGLIFNKDAFDKGIQMEMPRGPLPTRYSLKAYAPYTYMQTGATCVAQSFAFARTILAARQLRIRSRDTITNYLSFSPYFIYYRNKKSEDSDCSLGLDIESTVTDVLNNGFAPLAEVECPDYYPCSNYNLCVSTNGNFPPPNYYKAVKAALKYKIDAAYRIRNVDQLKAALSSKMPVIICMVVPESFETFTGSVWTTSSTDVGNKTMGHAMLAVSYDDEKYGGAIEVLNSWGKQWGNDGSAWIKYSDCLKWFSGAYAFFLDNSSVSMNNNSVADESFAMSADSSATKVAGTMKKDSVLKAEAIYLQLFKNK